MGAILGRGAGTSTIRVDGLGFLGLDARLTQSRCVTMIALTQVRGSEQVSMGAEGGSNALSTGNGRALQNFSDFVGTKCTGFRGGRTRGCETWLRGGSKLEISHRHGIHVSVVCRSPSLMLG